MNIGKPANSGPTPNSNSQAARLLKALKKKELKRVFEAEITAEIEELIGPNAADGIDFEAIETAIRREALQIAARAIEKRLNNDLSDYTGPTLPCECGAEARYAGRHTKTLTSVLGTLAVQRAYYSCDVCHKGIFPRDHALGIVDSLISPAVIRMIGHVGAMVSFEEGHELLNTLAGIKVTTKQVERSAEKLGVEISRDENNHIEPVCDFEVAPTLYLGMDGTGVPMRKAELAGRKGKQKDGSSKTREVKLCTVWSAESRDDEGVPVRDEGSVTYSAAIESAANKDTNEIPSDFAQRVMREATRRGFDRAKRRVVLGDGATWIWNLAEEYLPGAIQIVDRFHVKQHLFDAAKAIYGETSDLAKTWAHQRYEELDAGNTDKVLASLSVHASSCEVARKCVDYIKSNQQRMNYADFHAQGLCTSTGVVEAGCKTVIGTRLKRAGMHWTLRGANAIAALRCCKLSGRFEDFWERRVANG